MGSDTGIGIMTNGNSYRELLDAIDGLIDLVRNLKPHPKLGGNALEFTEQGAKKALTNDGKGYIM